jgi:hypothetical protein
VPLPVASPETTSMKKIALFLFLALAAFTSCKKDTATIDKPSAKINAPGFGPSAAAFAGAAWQLPAGIVLRDSIREASWWTEIHGGQTVPLRDFCGTPGGVFTVCLYLQNTTGQPITIQFPQELLILSTTIHSQNGVIINLTTVTIPAHSEKVLIAGAFCLNLGRSTPSLHTDAGALQAFSFGPATSPSQLKEIGDILRAKNITYQSLHRPDGMLDVEKMARMTLIQSAIWEATDGEGLTAETRAALMNL